jgi:Protein of unknown function (DUF2752)
MMTNPIQRRRQAHVALAAVVSAIVAISATLYLFPPETNPFYPQCPFHALTGLLCPGCGATRALATLVHGNLAGAMHWNGLVVLLLPVLALYGAIAYGRAVAGNAVAWPRVSNATVFTLLAVTMSFGVGRNLFGGFLSF